jgi:hypothetical protein
MTRPRLAVALAMAAACTVVHRLGEQSGLETKVPDRETPKFDESGGTKSQAGLDVRLAKAPG